MFSITNNTDTSLANMEEGVIVNDSETDLVLIQVRIPDLKAEKCLQFSREERVWDVKQQILAAMPKVCKSWNNICFIHFYTTSYETFPKRDRDVNFYQMR